MRPVALTLATEALLEVQPMLWKVALLGDMVPVSCWVWVMLRVTVVGATAMPVTGLGSISQYASSYSPWPVVLPNSSLD